MRAVISQRVDVLFERSERRDSLDQAWGLTLEYLVGQSLELLPMPNRPEKTETMLNLWKPQLVVLSGGNDLCVAPERDQTEMHLIEYAARCCLPLLAVCRGMQMLQHYFGGLLSPVIGHAACSHEIHSAPGQFYPTIKVNSYHEWGIKQNDLAKEFQPLYLHSDGTVEAAHHKSLPWLAVMWHPERSFPEDPANELITAWMQENIR